MRDRVGRRRAAAGRRHSRRLNAYAGKTGLRGRLGLSARSDGGRLRLSQRAFCGLGVRCCIRGAQSPEDFHVPLSTTRRDRLGYRRPAACRGRIGHRRSLPADRRVTKSPLSPAVALADDDALPEPLDVAVLPAAGVAAGAHKQVIRNRQLRSRTTSHHQKALRLRCSSR